MDFHLNERVWLPQCILFGVSENKITLSSVSIWHCRCVGLHIAYHDTFLLQLPTHDITLQGFKHLTTDFSKNPFKYRLPVSFSVFRATFYKRFPHQNAHIYCSPNQHVTPSETHSFLNEFQETNCEAKFYKWKSTNIQWDFFLLKYLSFFCVLI